MLTLKEYAQREGVTYEAVRSQVKRYEKELKKHIIVKNRTQHLDDYAIQFLDQKRNSSPVSVFNQSKSDDLEAAQRKNNELIEKITNLQSLVIELQNEIKVKDAEIIDLQRDKVNMLEEQKQLLIEQQTAKKKHWWNRKN